ncbi:hypothetical protein BGZ74_001490 [Mortierella antarctica]|nr:hypothetical protein BGZ74_001490 [Mortierella antarctica]
MVPPESRLLGDDPLKITARQFLKREHKPKNSSLRTETPADRGKRLRGEPKDNDEANDDDEPTYRSQANIEREVQIRKYNSERRSEWLMEAHAFKYIKSKAWQKDTDDNKEHNNPSARAFDHEKDVLGGRKIDHYQRDELVKQALHLGSKFSRGKKSSFL